MTSHPPRDIGLWDSSWAFLCDLDIPSIHPAAVELVNRLSGSLLLRHLDDGKASGSARYTVCDEVHRSNPAYCAEQLEQCSGSCPTVQVAYVQFLTHLTLPQGSTYCFQEAQLTTAV
jgi:hypothetical protein